MSERLPNQLIGQEGDLILTGTPSGVGPVAPGDEVTVELSTDSGKILSSLQFTAVQRESGYHFKPEWQYDPKGGQSDSNLSNDVATGVFAMILAALFGL